MPNLLHNSEDCLQDFDWRGKDVSLFLKRIQGFVPWVSLFFEFGRRQL